jgi:hypothetical protein
MAHQLDARMRECVDRCRICEQLCLESVTHCLEAGGDHGQVEHINLLRACGEICSTTARFILLATDFHARTCDLCADVCLACAASCETLLGDALLRRSADECRRCAELCRRVAAAPAPGW